MGNKQLVGIVGVILLFIGSFSPMLYIPIRGSITYIKNGQGDGILVLLLAFLAAYYLLKEKYRLVRLTAYLTLVILAFTFVNVLLKIYDIQQQSDNKITKFLANSISMEYGFAIVLSGAVLLLISSFIKETSNETDNSSFTNDHIETKTTRLYQKQHEFKNVESAKNANKKEIDEFLTGIQSSTNKSEEEYKDEPKVKPHKIQNKFIYKRNTGESFLKKYGFKLAILFIIGFNIYLYISRTSDNTKVSTKYEYVKTEISNSYEDQRGWGKAGIGTQIIPVNIRVGKMVNKYSNNFTHPVPAIELSVKNIGAEKLRSFGINFEVKDIDNKRSIGGISLASGSIEPGWTSNRHILTLPDSDFAKVMGGNYPLDFKMSIKVYVLISGGDVVELYNEVLEPTKLKELPTIRY